MIREKIKAVYRVITKKKLQDHRLHHTFITNSMGNIDLAKECKIWEYVIVRASTSKLVLGSNSHIGPFCAIFTGEHGVIIGDNVMLAPHCVLAAGNHEYRNLKTPMLLAGSFSNGPIVIEEDVWSGSNCTITDNVKIGKGAIVGANSVVTKDVPEYEIHAGTPARYIDTRKRFI